MYSAFQINHPPLGSGGGMAAICHTAARGGWAFECPFVRLGVGLARLCHATSRGVGGFGWSSWSGGGVGKTCQDGLVEPHPQCPTPLPIPTPHPQCPSPIPNAHQNPHPRCPMHIPNPPPIPKAHPQSSYPFPNLIPDAHPNSQSPMPIPNPHPEFPRLAGLGGAWKI